MGVIKATAYIYVKDIQEIKTFQVCLCCAKNTVMLITTQVISNVKILSPTTSLYTLISKDQKHNKIGEEEGLLHL